MKKLIALVLISLSFGAFAQHRHNGYNNHGHRGGSGWGWVAPALIGGAIVYGVTRPAPVQPPVVYTPPPVVIPPAPYGYHYEQLLDANCNCYRWVLVQG